VGRNTKGALLFLWGSELFVRGTYLFRTRHGRKIKHNLKQLCLVGIFNLSLPVLAPSYKHYILLPVKVRRICYLLAGLCAIYIYCNLFGWRGA
jgi:hypothetical protein